MPIYDYKCKECGTTYDIFHKVREIAEDVVCPSCGSRNHTRLISAPAFSMGEKKEGSSCENGACCGGACGLN